MENRLERMHTMESLATMTGKAARAGRTLRRVWRWLTSGYDAATTGGQGIC